MQSRVSTEEIIKAYQETGSVWKAGRRIGLAGQTVHERLKAIGYKMQSPRWTNEEKAELQKLAEAGLQIAEMARRLGRSYQGCATKLSEAGISLHGIAKEKRMNEKIPRGAGYDKQSMAKHLKAIQTYSGTVTQYARSQSLAIEPFVQSCEKHFPNKWREYVESHSKLAKRKCTGCGVMFIPNSGKQEYHSRKCATESRNDIKYFGGNRKAAIGLETGECQLCGRKPDKGLSVHHMLGKQNDPENVYLVALCPGCHGLVGSAAMRKIFRDSDAWEKFIHLVLLRSYGNEPQNLEEETYVEVSIEKWKTTQEEREEDEEPDPPPSFALAA